MTNCPSTPKPFRADGSDISTGRLKEIADNPYGDEEKCWLAKEGANKQVISSQADSLIKISRIWADYFSHQQLESACLGRFFAISGVIPGF
ncbi:hypothetical protein AB2939_000308 [Escherichia coli]